MPLPCATLTHMSNVLAGLDRLMTSNTSRAVAHAWRGMLNLLVPNPCVLCVWSDTVRHQLCTQCAVLLKEQCAQMFQAQDFAESLPLDLVTGQPLPVYAASFYTPEMSKVILKFKDHQRINLAGFLRPIVYRTLTQAAADLGAPYYRLVPVPASGASMRRRGYNPVVVMLPQQLPPRLRLDTRLVRPRWHFKTAAAHHGTGVQARRNEARKKFRLATSHAQPAEPILLIDDVLTTGATLAAVTRTLQSAGFDVAGAVVVSAVTPRG